MRRNRWPDVIGMGGRMFRNTHHSTKSSEAGLDHEQDPDESYDGGSHAACPNIFPQIEFAHEQDNERRDKDNR